MKYITYHFGDIEFDIEYNYIPEEPMVMYYADGSGHPGSSAEVEIRKIFIGSTEVYDILQDYVINDIEQFILENH